MDNIDIMEKISEQSKQALALFDFIYNLPTPVNIFVYRTIVKEAIALADLYPKEEAIKDLAFSLCNSHNGQLCQGGSLIAKALHVHVDSEREFKRMLLRKFYCDVEEYVKDIPSVIELTNTFYDIFKKDDSKHSFLNEDSQEPFLNATKENYINKPTGIKSNPFYKLSYISSVMYVFKRFWENEPDNPNYNDIFNKLYLKGNILNVIFDTIYKSDVTEISQQLYDILREKCDDNGYLCDIVNNVHERYCKLHYSINRLSKFTSSRKGDNYILHPSIGKIPGIEDAKQVDLMSDLWELFYSKVKNKNASEIGIDVYDFREIFKDDSPRYTLENVTKYKVNAFFTEVAKQLYHLNKNEVKGFMDKIRKIITIYKPSGEGILSDRSTDGTTGVEIDFQGKIKNEIEKKINKYK